MSATEYYFVLLYYTIWSIYSTKYVPQIFWSSLFTSAHCYRLYHLAEDEKLLDFLRILVMAVYFKDQNLISKTVYSQNTIHPTRKCSTIWKKMLTTDIFFNILGTNIFQLTYCSTILKNWNETVHHKKFD